MEGITKKAYAKINLFLSVGAKRQDGYHDIESVFHRISLHDEIKITKNGDGGIAFTCSDPTLPCDEKNLAVRAALLFFEQWGKSFGVTIHLEKHIPSQAGLGGGSADAAAVLCGLNALAGEPFSKSELAAMGATLGADVPFCVLGGCMVAKGIGELLSPHDVLPSLPLVVAKGDVGISTKDAYAALDARGVSATRDCRAMLDAITSGDIPGVAQLLQNDFEAVTDVHLPLKSALFKAGAAGALMSGSGSAVFGIFAEDKTAFLCAETLRKDGYFAEVCYPMT